MTHAPHAPTPAALAVAENINWIHSREAWSRTKSRDVVIAEILEAHTASLREELAALRSLGERTWSEINKTAVSSKPGEDAPKAIRWLNSELTAAHATIAELRKALLPFVDALKGEDAHMMAQVLTLECHREDIIDARKALFP